MELTWATGAPWAMGVNTGPVALAVVGGPTALASPPVALALPPRGGAGPAVGAAGLSKVHRMEPRTSNNPEARIMSPGCGARAMGTSSMRQLPWHGT